MQDESCPGQQGAIRSFRRYVRILERAFTRMLGSQTSCCGVTLPQCHTLLELDGAGCVNLNTLAGKLDLDKSTMSRTVDTLVQQGLVDRSADPANRRQQIICLSDQGTKAVATIHKVCDCQYAEIIQKVPQDKQAMVLESLEILAQAFGSTPSLPQAGCCTDPEGAKKEKKNGCCN